MEEKNNTKQWVVAAIILVVAVLLFMLAFSGKKEPAPTVTAPETKAEATAPANRISPLLLKRRPNSGNSRKKSRSLQKKARLYPKKLLVSLPQKPGAKRRNLRKKR